MPDRGGVLGPIGGGVNIVGAESAPLQVYGVGCWIFDSDDRLLEN
jgi:hypothetical protein